MYINITKGAIEKRKMRDFIKIRKKNIIYILFNTHIIEIARLGTQHTLYETDSRLVID